MNKKIDELKTNQASVDYTSIDLLRLPPGTEIDVQTKNSLYTIIKLGDEYPFYMIKGGKYEQFTTCTVLGSSFGRFSTLMYRRIEPFLQLEFYTKECSTITSPICNAIVRGPNYSYDMEWNNAR